MHSKFLVVGSETAEQRDARRRTAGASSAEVYAQTLRTLFPDCACDEISCVEDAPTPDIEGLKAFDAVFFAGSPIQMHDDTPETRAAAEFMRTVFDAGVPAFGSCAGLQIAVVAAGGAVKPRRSGMEAAFVRGIVATDAGRGHPLLRGRPVSWDALAMHMSEVDSLPDGAVVLASTKHTPVQAIEIRHGDGVFWGVQYHPEVALNDIAASLRSQTGELIEQGLVADRTAAETFADNVEALGADPSRQDLAWQLGVDEEVVDTSHRTVELRNFVAHFAKPS